MGLLTKLGLGAARKSVGSTQNKFMKVLDETDFGLTTADMPVNANVWQKIGTGFTVPAQQMYHYGYGTPELPDNQGYLYIYISDDTPAEEVGKVRLVQANAQETVKYVVAEYNMKSTHGSTTNKAMQIALPEQTQFPLVGEDSKLWLEVYVDGADSIDKDETHVYIPVTVYM